MEVSILSRDAVKEIDRRAVDQFRVPGIVLMENAGRQCADVLCRLGIRGPVVICCGSGNNAGDGLVIARHLDLRGFTVQLLFWSDPRGLRGDAAVNYEIAVRAELPVKVLTGPHDPRQLAECLIGVDWIVDAILGTGARGEPRPPLDAIIHQLNSHHARRMAVDVPSGLDCDTGLAAGATFRADHTCTFVAAKPGLIAPAARPWVGTIHVLDIGAPGKLLAQFGLKPAAGTTAATE
jgi:NAD(P)H-hydrate epimerase